MSNVNDHVRRILGRGIVQQWSLGRDGAKWSAQERVTISVIEGSNIIPSFRLFVSNNKQDGSSRRILDDLI